MAAPTAAPGRCDWICNPLTLLDNLSVDYKLNHCKYANQNTLPGVILISRWFHCGGVVQLYSGKKNVNESKETSQKLCQNKHVQPNIFIVYHLVHLVYIARLIPLFTMMFPPSGQNFLSQSKLRFLGGVSLRRLDQTSENLRTSSHPQPLDLSSVHTCSFCRLPVFSSGMSAGSPFTSSSKPAMKASKQTPAMLSFSAVRLLLNRTAEA